MCIIESPRVVEQELIENHPAMAGQHLFLAALVPQSGAAKSSQEQLRAASGS